MKLRRMLSAIFITLCIFASTALPAVAAVPTYYGDMTREEMQVENDKLKVEIYELYSLQTELTVKINEMMRNPYADRGQLYFLIMEKNKVSSELRYKQEIYAYLSGKLV